MQAVCFLLLPEKINECFFAVGMEHVGVNIFSVRLRSPASSRLFRYVWSPGQRGKLRRFDASSVLQGAVAALVNALHPKRGQVAMKADNLFVSQLPYFPGGQKGYALL